MTTAYFFILSFIAALNFIVSFRVNPKQCGSYILLFFAVFVSCVGHLFIALSTNVDQVVLANKLNYMGGIFLPMLTFDISLSVCNIRAPAWFHTLLMVITFVVLALSATVGFSDIYYKTVEFVSINGVGNYVATYGPGHDAFNFMLFGFVAANISLIVYAFIKKKGVSFKSLVALSFIEAATIFSFFLSRFLESDTMVMPAIYVFDQVMLLYICYRARRYDVTLTILNVLEESNTSGFISISSNMEFLGGNDIAYKLFPDLKECRVDHIPKTDSKIINFFTSWAKDNINHKAPSEKSLEQDDVYYKCSLKTVPLSRGEHINLFKIKDDTKLHRYVKMLGSSNVRLEVMLQNNATQLRAIQEQIIIGMANMVESRDSNTGGHIKRTSSVVAILVDFLRKDPKFDYSDEFYSAIVSAAPMHDLGKIAIDDRILRKPGKFTPEEYEEMKSHPAKGAMMIENLLSTIESPYFVQIAKNVAWYHHERYDGNGYPTKLKGEEIPFEARVMAVADVYDALVSKRCYKAELSFDKAYDIIIEGMGTQFDPSLKDCFIASRRKLEEYYSSLSDGKSPAELNPDEQ